MDRWQESAGYWLSDIYLSSTILLVAACLATSLLRQPVRRLAVGRAAAAGLAVLALLPLLPGWPRVGLDRFMAHDGSRPVSEVEDMTRKPVLNRDEGPAGALLTVPPAIEKAGGSVPEPATEPATEPVRIPVPGTARGGWRLTSVVVPFAAVAGILAVWLLLGALTTRRIARQTEPAPAHLQVLLGEIAGNQRRMPALRVSGRLGQPVALGLRRPLIVLPRTFLDELNPGEVEAVLVHEWDHIRRGDLWLLAVVRWLMVLFFAHPLFWWMRRKIHLDQEVLADAAASGRTGPIGYAEALVRWCRARRRIPFAFAGSSISARRGRILLRVKMLLEGKLAVEPRCPAALRLGAIGLAMAAATGLSIWTLHPGARIAKAAAPDGGQPSPADATVPAGAEGDLAADLVRQLYKDGSWTVGLSSFSMRSEFIQTETPEGRAAVSRRSTSRHVIEFAFDGKRLRHESRSVGGGISTEVHLWNGKEGTHYIQSKDYESYDLCKDPGFWGFINLWGHNEWANIGGYSFWWRPWNVQEFLSANSRLPEDYKSVGREVFAGAECQVVESKSGFNRLYIGVADRRLRGKIDYVWDEKIDWLKIMRPIAGDKVKTSEGWKPWLKTLDPTESHRMDKRLREGAFDAGRRKYFEYTFDDYRQVGPGRWVPWKVGMDIYEVHGEASSVASTTTQTTVLEVKVDEPLRDEFFQLQMKEGVKVADYRFDLPEAQLLRYTYKPGRTEAEFQALHEAERKNMAQQRKGFEGLTANVAARVGQRPCAFPEATWLNSKPLTWKDLEGKVVVLEFWAHDCGATLGDFQVFGKDFKTFVDAGVTIIGVHTATKSPKDVEKAIESPKLTIPVCIDAPGPDGKGFGSMTAWFGIDGAGGKMYPYLGGNGVIRIPYTVIVGKDGRVAAHGYLWEMLTKAREMAAVAGGGGAPPPPVEGKEAKGLPGPDRKPPPPAAPAPRAR